MIWRKFARQCNVFLREFALAIENMAWRRKQPKKGRPKQRQQRTWPVNPAALLPLLRVLLPVLFAGGALGGAAYGLVRLERTFHDSLLARSDRALPVLVDLPPVLVPLARSDLEQALQPVLDGDWTDNQFCRRAAAALADVAWVRSVRHVRRLSDARLEISCDYRQPIAFVRHDATYYLVDHEAVRLPGRYPYDPGLPLVEGVAGSPPQPGGRWLGSDLRAGLATLELLLKEPYAAQIYGVTVENYEGRRDPHRAHLVLMTDQPGGRIAWGSEPGMEIEENTAAQKMAILRENYRRTGRIDGGYAVIDVTTFPDRFDVVASEVSGV